MEKPKGRMQMNTKLGYLTAVALACGVSLVPSAMGNTIAQFADPVPGGGTDWMFMYIQGSHGLYGGWAGPPGITLETPLGTFNDCTMRAYPMYMYANGQVAGGQITFYTPGQVQVFQITFSNGFVDNAGLRCGPTTGGTVQFTYSAGGVQLPASVMAPPQGAWFDFEFHNRTQGPRGPQWTASFVCGAVGLKGDLNCDGVVSFGDINPFVQSLSDPASYANTFPWCDALNGDINNDGVENFGDINPFVALLSGGH
jgi:hypothetical protein